MKTIWPRRRGEPWKKPAELGTYLPLSFKTPKEQEYIEFLWDAFETNYTHGKYQFAFLAYHMLTMSCVYFNIWQIKQTRPEDFEKGLISFGKDIEKNLLEATSPFVFSTVNERSITTGSLSRRISRTPIQCLCKYAFKMHICKNIFLAPAETVLEGPRCGSVRRRR